MDPRAAIDPRVLWQPSAEWMENYLTSAHYKNFEAVATKYLDNHTFYDRDTLYILNHTLNVIFLLARSLGKSKLIDNTGLAELMHRYAREKNIHAGLYTLRPSHAEKTKVIFSRADLKDLVFNIPTESVRLDQFITDLAALGVITTKPATVQLTGDARQGLVDQYAQHPVVLACLALQQNSSKISRFAANAAIFSLHQEKNVGVDSTTIDFNHLVFGFMRKLLTELLLKQRTAEHPNCNPAFHTSNLLDFMRKQLPHPTTPILRNKLVEIMQLFAESASQAKPNDAVKNFFDPAFADFVKIILDKNNLTDFERLLLNELHRFGLIESADMFIELATPGSRPIEAERCIAYLGMLLEKATVAEKKIIYPKLLSYLNPPHTPAINRAALKCLQTYLFPKSGGMRESASPELTALLLEHKFLPVMTWKTAELLGEKKIDEGIKLGIEVLLIEPGVDPSNPHQPQNTQWLIKGLNRKTKFSAFCVDLFVHSGSFLTVFKAKGIKNYQELEKALLKLEVDQDSPLHYHHLTVIPYVFSTFEYGMTQSYESRFEQDLRYAVKNNLPTDFLHYCAGQHKLLPKKGKLVDDAIEFLTLVNNKRRISDQFKSLADMQAKLDLYRRTGAAAATDEATAPPPPYTGAGPAPAYDALPPSYEGEGDGKPGEQRQGRLYPPVMEEEKGAAGPSTAQQDPSAPPDSDDELGEVFFDATVYDVAPSAPAQVAAGAADPVDTASVDTIPADGSAAATPDAVLAPATVDAVPATLVVRPAACVMRGGAAPVSEDLLLALTDAQPDAPATELTVEPAVVEADAADVAETTATFAVLPLPAPMEPQLTARASEKQARDASLSSDEPAQASSHSVRVASPTLSADSSSPLMMQAMLAMMRSQVVMMSRQVRMDRDAAEEKRREAAHFIDTARTLEESASQLEGEAAGLLNQIAVLEKMLPPEKTNLSAMSMWQQPATLAADRSAKEASEKKALARSA